MGHNASIPVIQSIPGSSPESATDPRSQISSHPRSKIFCASFHIHPLHQTTLNFPMKNHAQIIPAGELAALEDQAAGAALTGQYHRAVSGMREVLIFGAMLMQIEEKVTVSTRGHGGKFGDKGSGLKGWLAENAPDISRPTALRMLGVTKAIAEEYRTIVGDRIAKKFDLPALVLAEPDQLPEAAKLKQGELFDYVSGTSQRSWLDRFQPRSSMGGYRPRQGPEPTPQEVREAYKKMATETFQRLLVDLTEFAITKPQRGFDLLGDADKRIFRELILDLHKTYRK